MKKDNKKGRRGELTRCREIAERPGGSINCRHIEDSGMEGSSRFRNYVSQLMSRPVNHVEIYFNRAKANEEIVGRDPYTIEKECSCGILFEILLRFELIEGLVRTRLALGESHVLRVSNTLEEQCSVSGPCPMI